MKWRPCGCNPEHFERLERMWWMRLGLFKERRYYHCVRCKANMFIRREEARVRAPSS